MAVALTKERRAVIDASVGREKVQHRHGVCDGRGWRSRGPIRSLTAPRHARVFVLC